MNKFEIVNFFFLMTILVCGVLTICLIFWALLRYFKRSYSVKINSSVVLTKGKVIKKFYSGGDPRVDGRPTMKLKFTHEKTEHVIDQQVEQEIFFEYDEGEEIDLFVSSTKDLQVYPLKSIQKNRSVV